MSKMVKRFCMAAVMAVIGILPAVTSAATVSDFVSLRSAVQNGGEVTLEADIAVTTTLPVSKDLTINLGGYKLTGGQSLFKLNGGTLTIKDDTGENPDITAGTGPVVQINTLGSNVIVKNGKYNVKIIGFTDGAIENAVDDAMVYEVDYLDLSADISIEGGEFTANTIADFPEEVTAGDAVYTTTGVDVTITGGTFSSDPSAYGTIPTDAVNGYYATTQVSGDYQVLPAVATDGTSYYANLTDAVNGTAANGTITLIADDTVSFANGGVAIDKNLTIDGDGYTITGVSDVGSGNVASESEINDSTVHGFYIKGGDVTIKNVTLTQFGDTDYVNKFGRVPVLTSTSYTGNLTLQNVNIDKFNRQAICTFGGTLTVTGGTITANATNKGAGFDQFQQPIEVRGGTATIDGVTITGGNSSLSYSGGAIVAFPGSTATINNANINFTGIGVWSDTATVTVTGSGTTITATDKVVFVEEAGTANIVDGTYDGTLGVDSDTNSKIAVSGGKFSTPVPDAFCADSVISNAESEADGYYTLTAAVATVIRGGSVLGKYDSLASAFAAANTAGDILKINVAGTYALQNHSANIIIEGTVDGVVFDCQSAYEGNISSFSNGVTFKNVKINVLKAFENNAWSYKDYYGFKSSGKITMDSCTISGKIFSYADMVFNSCKFYMDLSDYNMWVYGSGVVEYLDCTFVNDVTSKFLNLYQEASEVHTVIVKGCKFINNGESSKAALNVKATCNSTALNYSVIVEDSTTEGAFPAASASDKLVVIDSLVQVDDRKADVASKIAVVEGENLVLNDGNEIIGGTITAEYRDASAELPIADGYVDMDTSIDGVYTVVPGWVITFNDYDGTELAVVKTAADEVPAYPNAAPTRATDSDGVYAFAGWATSADGEALATLPAATAAATYYAVYTTTAVVAKIGDTYYTSFADAVSALKDGETITVINYNPDTMTEPAGWAFFTSDGVTTLERAVAVIGAKGYMTLAEAVDAAGSEETITLLRDTEETQIKIPAGKTVTIVGDSESVSFTGQFKVSGLLNLNNMTVKTPKAAVSGEVSQYSKSAIALVNEGDVNCKNVIFEMGTPGVNDATAITAWWSTGTGANIYVEDCTFNCAGQRPVRSDACVTMVNCIVNDPYRYVVQMTSKSSTMAADADAFVVFTGNTINAGTTSTKPVYGVQLEGGTYGCSDLTINGSDNTLNLGDTGKSAALYFAENTDKVEFSTIGWNTEVAPALDGGNFAAKIVREDATYYYTDFATAVAAYEDDDTIIVLDYVAGTTEIPEDWGVKTENDVTILYLLPMIVNVTQGETVTQYNSLQKALNAAATAGADVTVDILDDIDLTGTTWTSVYLNGYDGSAKNIIVQGNNKTITGLTSPLIRKIWSSASIKFFDLTIVDSTIAAVSAVDTCVAAFVAGIDSGSGAEFSNCKVSGCTLTGAKYSGAFIGYTSDRNAIMISDCTVENCIINGTGSSGALIGHTTSAKVTIADTSVTGNSITGETIAKTGILIGTDQGTTSFSATETGNSLYAGETQLTGDDIHEIGRVVNGTVTVTESGSYSVDPTITSTGTIAIVEDFEVTSTSDGYTVSALPDVAMIGNDGYTSLQKAIDAAHGMTGDVTITLASDVTEYVVVHQKEGLNLTIDGQNQTHTITGQIIIDGDGRSSGTDTLTIRGIKFTGTKADFYTGTDAFILVPSTKDTGKIYTTGKYNYAHNITVTNCSFTGAEGTMDVVGVKSTSGATHYNFKLEDSTAKNVHSLAQLIACVGATITGCEVSNAKNGINFSGSSGTVTIANNTVSVTNGYGFRVKSNGSEDDIVATLTDNTITGEKGSEDEDGAVVVTDGKVIIVSGKYDGDIYTTTAGNLELTGGSYSDTAATVAEYIDPELYAVVEVTDENGITWRTLSASNVTVTHDGTTTGYVTLAEAIDAANDGDTVKLLGNCSGGGIIVPQGKFATVGLTVDFAGYTYTVDSDPLAGSTGTQNQCFQLKKGNKITFKDGAIVADYADVQMIIQNYSDLTLDNMTLDATQGSNSVGYVVSTNNGSTIINNSSITAKTGGVAFDACTGWGGYLANSVSLTGGSVVTGDIEVSYYYGSGSTPTVLTLDSGTISGDIVMADGAADSTILKKTDFDQAAPAEYAWVTSEQEGYQTLAQAVAKFGDTYYATLQAAIDAAEEADTANIVIDLLGDATLDVNAWSGTKNPNAIGTVNTVSITVNGNGHTLTFMTIDTDWNNVATMNDAQTKLILNDMTIDQGGRNTKGTWNSYDINFNCAVELNNVTSKRPLAFKNGATLNDVTINADISKDVYGIWIQANGQTVSIDGLTVNVSNGRGIKVDEQYVTAPQDVTLSVKDATFNTAKKPAIFVKSSAATTITTSGTVDISGVAADSVNLVWVDKDAADKYGLVSLNGKQLNIIPEGTEDAYKAFVSADGEWIDGYYKTLAEAVDAAAESTYTVVMLADSSEEIEIAKAITITRNGFTADSLTAAANWVLVTTDETYSTVGAVAFTTVDGISTYHASFADAIAAANQAGLDEIGVLDATATLEDTAWELVTDGDVTTLKRKGGYVAQIVDGDYFENLQDALDAAADGDTVLLLKTYAVPGGYPLYNTYADCTLDLNGYTLTGAVMAEYDFTLTDSSSEQTGTVAEPTGEIRSYEGEDPESWDGAVWVREGVTVTISGGTFTSPAAVLYDSGASVAISGGTFTGTSAVVVDSELPGIYGYTARKPGDIDCEVSITGGTFDYASGYAVATAAAAKGVSLAISGGEFTAQDAWKVNKTVSEVTVTGGYFAQEPKASFIPYGEAYQIEDAEDAHNGWWTIAVEDYVATITGITVSDSAATVTVSVPAYAAGDTVKLWAKVDYNDNYWAQVGEATASGEEVTFSDVPVSYNTIYTASVGEFDASVKTGGANVVGSLSVTVPARGCVIGVPYSEIGESDFITVQQLFDASSLKNGDEVETANNVYTWNAASKVWEADDEDVIDQLLPGAAVYFYRKETGSVRINGEVKAWATEQPWEDAVEWAAGINDYGEIWTSSANPSAVSVQDIPYLGLGSNDALWITTADGRFRELKWNGSQWYYTVTVYEGWDETEVPVTDLTIEAGSAFMYTK